MNQSKFFKLMMLVISAMILSGCLYDTAGNSSMSASNNTGTEVTTDPDKAAEPVRAAGGPLGGYIEQFMDANDKTKMVRAMDGGLGKANRWKNPATGAEFAMTPLSKASGNGICRNYSLSMTKSGITDRVNGTACIGEDGVWHST